MSAVIIANNLQGQKPPAPPLKDDNNLYAYRMHFRDLSQIAFADDQESLIDVLLPGYEKGTEEEKFVARMNYLASVIVRLRASILADVLSDKETFESLSQEEIQILGSSQRQIVLDSETLPLWKSEVPLALLDLDYAPYSDTAPPRRAPEQTNNPHNIIWLSPVTETDFLESLDRVGVIIFYSTLPKFAESRGIEVPTLDDFLQEVENAANAGTPKKKKKPAQKKDATETHHSAPASAATNEDVDDSDK